MAEIFILVVSIIIAAGVCAKGIKALGGVNILTNAVSNLGTGNFAWFGILLSIAILSFLVYFATVIMGSGIAAFNAFGKLAPDIATKLGIAPITLVLPVEIASCLGRAASPIAGGIIALAGFAKVAPMDIIDHSSFTYRYACKRACSLLSSTNQSCVKRTKHYKNSSIFK